MRCPHSFAVPFVLVFVAGCSSKAASSNSTDSSPATDSHATTASDSQTTTDSHSTTTTTADSTPAIDATTTTAADSVTHTDSVVADSGSTATDSGTVVTDVTIPTKCTSALPAGSQLADVSNPASVVGTGTAGSCTFALLNAAVTKGGVITFDCGSAPVTIPITATMNLPTGANTVIDGGNLVTLDGQNSVQILSFNHNNYRVNTFGLTVQRLTFINAKTNPVDVIPTAPAPCSQGYDDGEGGAIFMNDGNLTVIDCTFSNNQAALLGPDTGGGAIYIEGSLNGALIVGSVFTNNKASNAGAVGALNASLRIYNSLFENNTATGNGANDNDPSTCSVINNGQNEVGSGGNGGAVYMDGAGGVSITLCGDDIVNNAAGVNAFGGGVFMTSDDWSGPLTIADSTITGNTGGSWTQVQSGSVTDVGSAFGVNAESITVTNSTLQGL